MGAPDAAELFAPRRPARWSDPWRRFRPLRFVLDQFDGRETWKRRAFDVTFGAVVPHVLVLLERVMFTDGIFGVDGVVPFRPYPGLLAGLGTLVICLSFVRVDAIRRLVAGAGLLVVAAAGSASIAMLPLSLFGIFLAGIGLLGLLPFLGVFAQLRVALRAIRTPPPGGSRARAVALVVAGLVLTLGGLLLTERALERVVHRDTDVLIGKRAGDAEWATIRLAILWRWPAVSLSRLNDAAVEQWVVQPYGTPAGEDAPLVKRWKAVTGMDRPVEMW